MKVLHVVPTFYPATYWGGPIHSLYSLCRVLAIVPDVELRVLTTDAAGPHCSDSLNRKGSTIYPGEYEVLFSRRVCGISVSPGLLFRLRSMIIWSDIVHLTGAYSFPTIPTLLLCRLLDRPVVWSPRGALQRWEGTTKILLKRVWENICNELVSHKRCIMHVTSEQEAAQSSVKIPNAGIAIVHNGVEIPNQLRARQWIPNGTMRLLYIGRLHPKKGIENLLEALPMLNDETVSLRVCGKGEDTYLLSLRKKVRHLGLETSVTFDGHVDGENKLEAFMRADACVVPSFTENFGMVVAEALAHGVPVVTSRGTPWSDVEKHGCGLWIDNKPRAIADAIRSLRAMDLRAMGNKGRDWINAAYRWDAVGRSMITVYERLVTKRP